MTKIILALSLVGVLALTGIAAYYIDSQQSNHINVASDSSVQQTETQAEQTENQAEQTENQVELIGTTQDVGRTAYIDPTTGKLVSQPAQVIQPGNVAIGTENLPPVKITTHANGMVQADLNGRFRMPLQATIGCDGKLTKQHSNSELPSAPDCEAEE